ncbi:winged helix-turn-helix transcriptional regulator [Chitinophaga nivalis]|uniref:Helix-turn-helix transcriptional regulator n=1 Tax=Chitinophaga nivalis TaxID=2991709 RepID=A0ABT3IL63_9BACT|nr:helix-turn-helix domain-containing protein [Chitinophaga nivalis]MCW3465784.1 helix-turn-helix transcriptional regulator [Chitinophaga nivalis]MCW3484525.1 helix-turn-helix transcriptional regulator [Chitinophaga nivalis]
MYEKKIPENLECGISIAIKVLGGKWKAWIIDCINNGVLRPSEIHRRIDSASPRVINMQLKELEDYGIIGKTIYPGLPLKVEYYLTEVGKSILPVINAMDKWGNEKREFIVPGIEAMQPEHQY